MRLAQLLSGTRAPSVQFDDERLTELLFRLRARRDEARSSDGTNRWRATGRAKLIDGVGGGLTLPDFSSAPRDVPDAPGVIVEALCEHAEIDVEGRLRGAGAYDGHQLSSFAESGSASMPIGCSHDVTLALPEGTTSAVVGESGSGKSTLLQLINAVYRADSGTVKVLDREIPRTTCICGEERSAIRTGRRAVSASDRVRKRHAACALVGP